MLIPKTIFPIAGFCAKEDFRYAISRVQLKRENGKSVAFATDGQILCRASWEEDLSFPDIGLDQSPKQDFDVTICNETWRSIDKSIQRRKFNPQNALVEESHNGKLRIGTTDFSSHSIKEEVLGEHRFPDCESCIPETNDEDFVKFRLDLDLLKRLTTSLCKMIEGEPKYATMFVPKKKDFPNRIPIVIETTDDDGKEIKAILMPVSSDRPT